MKTIGTFLACLILIASPGCKSHPDRVALNTFEAVQFSVDAGMTVWGQHVAAGGATIEQEREVEAAFNHYKASMRAARLAVVTYYAAKDKPAGQALFAALDALSTQQTAILKLISDYAR